MKRLAVVVYLLVLVANVQLEAAEKSYGNVVVAEVISIYDADTFRVNVTGWPDIIGNRISIRVSGVDAPEIRGKCKTEKQAARQAKQFTVAALRAARQIELRNMQRGKYFRIVADVYIDGENLATSLIKAKHARPYDGGTRKGWCAGKL